MQEFSLDLAMAWVDQACGGFFDASTEAKRKALEAAYTDVVTTNLPEWNQSSELLNWLAGL